ncbi:probable histone acetyltransferase type B catalytic subunit [Magnolia sinica]|uniref:probable histone acetyltransferase type B catalytic subunit n=1 Tax=Magnolia sinica TaxID=86752 RepID=UPI002657F305|nr:probable histone acetyltransferase type B catalytic subunit [Magnolia sinica]
MVPKQKGSIDLPTEGRKRRRGFAAIDVGIEANECIKIYLVNSVDEVDTADSFCFEPVDLNRFFGEDGRIYGYKDLKIDIWLNGISFHAYADISFQSTFNGSKGTTDLDPALKKIFGESLVEKKEEFLQTFTTDRHYISTIISHGEVVHCEASKGRDNTTQNLVIRMGLRSMPVGELYSRLVPLVFLNVEGGSAIDVTDPRWDIYLVVERKAGQSGTIDSKLLGFASIYRFFHYPDSTRLRISQILVLPPYQGQGYGRLLLETLNSMAIYENVYDVTAEEPSDYLQHVRGCIDTLRLLAFEPIKPAITSVTSQLKQSNFSKKTSKFHSDPPANVVEGVRKLFKINKKQFLRCWEVLIYLSLDTKDRLCMENFRACIFDRVKAYVLGKDVGSAGKNLTDVPNDYEHDMTFVMFRSRAAGGALDAEVDGNQKVKEEQLGQVVNERMEEIVEIAKKVSLHCRS